MKGSPAELGHLAKDYTEGIVKKGADGKKWVVRQQLNGKRWKPVSLNTATLDDAVVYFKALLARPRGKADLGEFALVCRKLDSYNFNWQEKFVDVLRETPKHDQTVLQLGKRTKINGAMVNTLPGKYDLFSYYRIGDLPNLVVLRHCKYSGYRPLTTRLYQQTIHGAKPKSVTIDGVKTSFTSPYSIIFHQTREAIVMIAFVMSI